MRGVQQQMQQAKVSDRRHRKILRRYDEVSQAEASALTRLSLKRLTNTNCCMTTSASSKRPDPTRLPIAQRATHHGEQNGRKQLMTYLLNKAKELNIHRLHASCPLWTTEEGDVIGARVRPARL